jgi:hypothetical protein
VPVDCPHGGSISLEWGALIGEYASDDGAFIIKGRAVEYEGKPSPPIGSFLRNQWLSRGTVEATLHFSAVEAVSAAALILNYNLASKAFLAAGLGASQGSGTSTMRRAKSRICVRNATIASWPPSPDPASLLA